MSTRDAPVGWDRYVRSLGLALQRRRVAVGLTQEELAHTAGITRSHYQQLEKGASRPGTLANPSLMTLVQLSSALGLELSELLGDLDDVDVVTGRRPA